MAIHGNVNIGERVRETILCDCCHVDTGYAVATGLDLTTDYSPAEHMHAIMLCDKAGANATGNINVVMAGGGEMLIPCSVSAGKHEIILRDTLIKTIKSSTSSTFDGKVIPLW